MHKDNLLLRSYKFIMRNKLMAAIVLATILVGGTIFWMKYANYREFDNLVAMADQRTLSADKCRKQIEDLVAMKNTAELSPEDEAYRQREIMRLRMRKNIHLASARALLFLALKKDGHRLPEHMIESLKTTWFLELQSYLRLSDYRGGRQAFREMRDFLNPDNDIMKWTESEN